MSTEKQFIEIKKVISDKESGVNVSSRPEGIDISDIKGFRPWHKGKKDNEISGEMTLLKVIDRKTEELKTLLIEESYSSFVNRLSYRAVVRKLNE